MFGFHGTNIFRNGDRYCLAGAVPAHPRCVRFRSPTSSDVMGGRIVERNGKRYGWTSRAFPTAKDATRAVRLAGGTVVQVLG